MRNWNIFGLLTCLVGFGHAGRQCDSNEPCVNIHLCPLMFDLLRNEATTNRTVKIYLRNSLCGFENNDPKVCCPSEPSSMGNDNKDSSGDNGEGDNIRSMQRLALPVKCGISYSNDFPRILEGSPADPGQWPWMAALGFKNKHRNQNIILWRCGGSLITHKHVLTAAHCLVHPSLMLVKVRLGELDLDDNIPDYASPVDFDFEKLIPHEEFNGRDNYNDIGLIKLAQSVHFTNFIQPICLPSAPELRSQNYVEKNPFTAGWGNIKFRGPSSSRLLQVQVPVLDNSICDTNYKAKGYNIANTHICAGYLTGGKDACQGDSGGPLMWPNLGTFYLIGVVSNGYKCGEKDYPGIYTRVTEYIDWISTNIQK